MKPIGVIFTGGEGPPPHQIDRIMEEAHALGDPVIAAADSGLLLAEKAGLTPDWIIGDMDSLEEYGGSRLKAYPPEKIFRYPHDKDFTDTELAFSLLREKGCVIVWIAGGGGGRLDQLFGIRSLFERDNPPERWVTGADDIYCIEAGHKSLAAGLEKKTYGLVSVFPLGPGPWEAESTGLKWPLAGLTWARDFIAISNEAPDGYFSIKARKGRFLVMRLLED